MTLARVLSIVPGFGDLPECVVSQWATGSESRKGRVQHYDWKRAHDRLSPWRTLSGAFDSRSVTAQRWLCDLAR